MGKAIDMLLGVRMERLKYEILVTWLISLQLMLLGTE